MQPTQLKRPAPQSVLGGWGGVGCGPGGIPGGTHHTSPKPANRRSRILPRPQRLQVQHCTMEMMLDTTSEMPHTAYTYAPAGRRQRRAFGRTAAGATRVAATEATVPPVMASADTPRALHPTTIHAGQPPLTEGGVIPVCAQRAGGVDRGCKALDGIGHLRSRGVAGELGTGRDAACGRGRAASRRTAERGTQAAGQLTLSSLIATMLQGEQKAAGNQHRPLLYRYRGYRAPQGWRRPLAEHSGDVAGGDPRCYQRAQTLTR